MFCNSDTITETNKRFDLGTAYETLKHRLSIYSGEGSGWIIDKIVDIWINISNYDPLAGSSYIPLPSKLNNPKTLNVLNGVILDLLILQIVTLRD